MSHKIEVAGNFGSRETLEAELASRNIAFVAREEKGETFLTFPGNSTLNKYGNDLRINVTNPQKSTVDSDVGRIVGEIYQASMARHVRNECAMRGISIMSETRNSGNLVLRVAVG